MCADVLAVHLKVEPVEDGGLDETQDGLAEKGVEREDTAGLEHDAHHRVTEDKRHKCIGAFDLVFDVHGREEFEEAAKTTGRRRLVRARITEENDRDDAAEQIDCQRDEDKDEPSSVRGSFTGPLRFSCGFGSSASVLQAGLCCRGINSGRGNGGAGNPERGAY